MALRKIPIPQGVELEDEGKRVLVRWPGDRVSEFLAFDLRAECPCASCVDEFSGKRILERDKVDSGVAVIQVGRVGRYAFQFKFSDNHSTGIYTYEKMWQDSGPPDAGTPAE